MKFGKLPDISNIDFTLPTDTGTNADLFSRLSAVDKSKIYIGCTGWSMKEWVGRVYPKGTKTKDYLQHYGKQFNTIELNTTHYRIPSFDMIQKWYAETPADFRFCPKIPQTISHRNDMGLTDGTLQLFCESIVGLKEKLGCCFMQMPPYFGVNDLPRLRLFLEQFPKGIPLAIELRHESWFKSEHNFSLAAELLKQYGKAIVITDVAGRRDVLHNRLTNHIAMIRYVGNAGETALHPTDFERLNAWVQKLKEWTAKGISEVYFFTHEPDNLLAPEAADYFAKAIQENVPAITRGPEFTDGNAGEQMSIF
ncbi:MAG: hypothetical protein ACI85O_002219 [Saprospiraceae bacterium]|jgi:uncharacterized protein YecE (DUF72 family)